MANRQHQASSAGSATTGFRCDNDRCDNRPYYQVGHGRSGIWACADHVHTIPLRPQSTLGHAPPAAPTVDGFDFEAINRAVSAEETPRWHWRVSRDGHYLGILPNDIDQLDEVCNILARSR